MAVLNHAGIVKLIKSFSDLRQVYRDAMLNQCLVALGVEQRQADPYDFLLVENGRVVMILVVHVDDIFAVGDRKRCDEFGQELNKPVPVKNMGYLRWHSGCFYVRKKDTSRLKLFRSRLTRRSWRQKWSRVGQAHPIACECEAFWIH